MTTRPILPLTLTDLQLDFMIMPSDRALAQRLQRRVKQLSLLMIDAQDFSLHYMDRISQLTRCVLLIRFSGGGMNQPDYYKKIVTLFQFNNKFFVEIAEDAFDRMLKQLEIKSREMIAHSAAIQGLSQDQIAQLPISSGYANCSSIEHGFGNSSISINQQLQLNVLPQSNAFINTMIFAVHDFNHSFAPNYSEQMRCEASLALSQVVPATMYANQSDSYSPIQMLPPLCDDPTNAMFYVNDSRPVGSGVKSIPIPRLIIRGCMLLPVNEQIIKKNEEFNKTVGDLAWVYKSYEQNLALSVHAISHIFANSISYANNVCKILHEQIQQIKSGQVKKIDFQGQDFIFANSQQKSLDTIQSIQSLNQTEEPFIDLSQIQKSLPTFLDHVKKQLKGAIGYVLQQNLSTNETDYLTAVISGMNETKLNQIVQYYLEMYVKNCNQNCDAIIDFDEFGYIMASNLKIILFRRLIAGFYNDKLQNNKQIYLQMQMPYIHMSAFDRYRVETKEFKHKKCGVEMEYRPGPLSQKTIGMLINALDDVIVIRPANQPELKDSVFIVPKNGRIFTTYMLIKIMAQFIRVNKGFKDKPTQMNTQIQFNQFYCVENIEKDVSQRENEDVIAQEPDEEDVNQKTNRDRFKRIKIAEDTTKGKCSVCPQVFNNYKEHIKSNLHKLRYQEELTKESMMGPLKQMNQKIAIKDQVRTQLSSLCIFICAKEQKSYVKVAKEMNQILLSMTGVTLFVDPDDEPRAGSPTCRSENFRAWRENILKMRAQSFEDVISSPKFDLNKNDYLQQIVSSIVYATDRQQELLRHQQIKAVLEKLIAKHPQLKETEVKEVNEFDCCYSNQQQSVQNQQAAPQPLFVDKKLYLQTEVPDESKPFTGVVDMIKPQDLFGQLSLVAMLQDERVLYRYSDKVQLKPNTFNHFNLQTFEVQQESVKQMLNLEFSPKFDVWFQFSFNKFADEFEANQKLVDDNQKKISTAEQTMTDVNKTVKQVSTLDDKLFLHNKEFLKQVTDKASFYQMNHNYAFMQELRFELEQQEIRIFNKPLPMIKHLSEHIACSKQHQIDEVTGILDCNNVLNLPPIYQFQQKSAQSVKELFAKAMHVDISKEIVREADFDKVIIVQKQMISDQELFLNFWKFAQKAPQIAQLVKFAELDQLSFDKMEQYLLNLVDEDDDELEVNGDWGQDDSCVSYDSIKKMLDLDRQEMESLFNKQQKLKRGTQKLQPFVYQVADLELPDLADAIEKPTRRELVRSNSFTEGLELSPFSVSQYLADCDESLASLKEERMQTLCSLRRQPSLIDYCNQAHSQWQAQQFDVDEGQDEMQNEFSQTNKVQTQQQPLSRTEPQQAQSNLFGLMRNFHFYGKYVTMQNINSSVLRAVLAQVTQKVGPPALMLRLGRAFDALSSGLLCQIAEQGTISNNLDKNVDSGLAALLYQATGTNLAASEVRLEQDCFRPWVGQRRTIQRYSAPGAAFDVE